MYHVAVLKNGHIQASERKTVRGLFDEEKVWVDVNGFDEKTLYALKKEFNLHSLTVEDCLRRRTRIKIEEFRKYTYVVIKGVLYKKKKRFGYEQVNYIVGKNFLITVSYRKRKSIEKLKNNQKQLATLFKKGPGLEFVLHHLIDMEVDRFFPYLEQIDDEVDALEEEALQKQKIDLLGPIFDLKKETVQIKKIVAASTTVIRTLSIREVKFIDSDIMIYFRDINDHLVSLTDTVETLRDLITNTLDIEFAVSSYRMNDVMRILTIITTLFMPLTFITGLYGMNFKYMPELQLPFGYPVVIGIMIIIEILMLFYFKRKKWL
ncbi:magnesium/cobalt transporter CorA [Patescibacteria group bacterium]|nr:magnesium/cobalt transporter CorA [Patescibacteria group bacterium]